MLNAFNAFISLYVFFVNQNVIALYFLENYGPLFVRIKTT